MTASLSDHLKATRDALRRRRTCGLFLLPMSLGSLIRRFNTLIALAEELEAELLIAQSRPYEFDDLPKTATILRFPRRLVVVCREDNGGDAA